MRYNSNDLKKLLRIITPFVISVIYFSIVTFGIFIKEKNITWLDAKRSISIIAIILVIDYIIKLRNPDRILKIWLIELGVFGILYFLSKSHL